MTRLSTLLGPTGIAALVVASIACSAPAEETRAEVLPADAAADPSGANLGESYFSVRPDRRPCAAPLCGGFWVKRVNSARTYCANGQWSQSCYVARLELAPLGLTPLDEADLRSDVARVLVRGRIEAQMFPGTGELGSLNATEAWRAPAAATITGTCYMLESSSDGITAKKLNASSYPQKIAGLNLDPAPGTPEDKDDALARMGRQGLVVAGADVPAKNGVGLDVSDFFARVAAGN